MQAKFITPRVEAMPNYFWHLMALSNIWDIPHSAYRELHAATLDTASRDYLYQHRHLIAWGNGQVSKLTVPLFFDPFKKPVQAPEYFAWLEDPRDCDLSPKEAGILKQIGAIFRSHHESWERTLWPHTRDTLTRLGDGIVARLDPGVIGQWEERLGMEFAEPGFEPVLTSPNGIDPLPSANNLTLSRNNFGITEQSLPFVVDLMIHEIGIFTLMPVLGPLMHDPAYQTEWHVRHGIVYQAFESYVEFCKKDVNGYSRTWEGTMHNGSTLNMEWFFDWYGNNRAQDHEGCIREAIEGYAQHMTTEQEHD